jgi:hypothetical protein
MHKVEKRRMERLCSRLTAAYKAGEYPYNLESVNPPQTYIPDDIKEDSKTYAYFLFTLCLWMRGGIASDTATRSLVKLHRYEPRLFDPHWVISQDPVELALFLDRHGLGRDSKLNAELWVGNSRLLVDRWHGDPRLIFHDFGRYSEKKKWEIALQRIMNQGNRGQKGGFGGFREKMTSMLIYYLTETDLIPTFDTPVPVDFHVARMMVIHKVFVLEPDVAYTGRRLNELLDAIRYETYRFAKKHGVSSVELCDALWLYSRHMCTRSPAFKANIGEKNGRKTEIFPYAPRWSEPEMRSYANTCGRCVVHDTCEAVVRAAYWYHAGSLQIEAQHEPYQLTLLPPEINRALYL